MDSALVCDITLVMSLEVNKKLEKVKAKGKHCNKTLWGKIVHLHAAPYFYSTKEVHAYM